MTVARESADLSLPQSCMAVVPIRIVGDPVLHTATSPIPVGDDGSLPAGSGRSHRRSLRHDGRRQRCRLGRQPDRRVPARVRLRLRRRARPHDPASRRRSSTRCSRPPRCPRRCPTPTTTTRAACRFPASRSRTGRASWARVTGLDADGTPITLEGTGLFARMLQHETGHLDGFLYLDRLIGRHARAAKRAVKSNGWGVPGLTLDARRGPRSVRALDPCPTCPPVGTRVSLRYRLPAGSVPPLSDVVGHLLEVGPDAAGARPSAATWSTCRPRPTWCRSAAVGCAGAQLATSATSSTPRRWRGRASSSEWLDGWLLRFGHGSHPAGELGGAACCPRPASTLRAIADWYAARGVPPLVAVPDRLFRLPRRRADRRRERGHDKAIDRGHGRRPR